MSLISYALKMARKYYDKETFAHSMRVAAYVTENNLIPDEQMDDCIALAIMHDLLEDTEYHISDKMDQYLSDCLRLITKPKEQDYIEYIKNIREHADMYQLTYWVKLADMKDHLIQTETLTDKLKEKYLKAIPYLL